MSLKHNVNIKIEHGKTNTNYKNAVLAGFSISIIKQKNREYSKEKQSITNAAFNFYSFFLIARLGRFVIIK